MKIALASDHAGYAEKERLKPLLLELGLEIEDLGTLSEESVDYPDYARKVAEQVADGLVELRFRGNHHQVWLAKLLAPGGRILWPSGRCFFCRGPHLIQQQLTLLIRPLPHSRLLCPR